MDESSVKRGGCDGVCEDRETINIIIKWVRLRRVF